MAIAPCKTHLGRTLSCATLSANPRQLFQVLPQPRHSGGQELRPLRCRKRLQIEHPSPQRVHRNSDRPVLSGGTQPPAQFPVPRRGEDVAFAPLSAGRMVRGADKSMLVEAPDQRIDRPGTPAPMRVQRAQEFLPEGIGGAGPLVPDLAQYTPFQFGEPAACFSF